MSPLYPRGDEPCRGRIPRGMAETKSGVRKIEDMQA